jgi:hypothetical protein
MLRHPRRLAAAAVLAGALAVPAFAFAATKNGITPTSPKAGATVPRGKAVTFKGKVTGEGTVFVHVCRSAKRAADGTICIKETIGEATVRNGTFSYRQKVFNFPAYFLNRRGTYYWQAHRILCEDDLNDCRQEGPIVRFKVG